METRINGLTLSQRVWVLTVPMRNGNIDIQMHSERTNNGSYRTYEEWKRGEINETLQEGLGSYRTYEEWKRQSLMYRMKSE